MTSQPASRPLHPSIVLGAYLEPVVRGRRVAVLGDATVGLAETLGSRGARLVHAYDPDPARVAEALARSVAGRTPAVTYACFDGSDLGVRDGAFDVVVVPDLSAFADPGELLRRARRLVGGGVAVVVAPNVAKDHEGPSRRLLGAPRRSPSPGYYELYDLVSLQFPRVRMIGQAPFVGYTVAEFAAAGEADVSIDTSLLEASEEPEHFIAVASERPVVLETYALIELPWAGVAEATGGSRALAAEAAEAPSSVRDEQRLALTEAQARLALLDAELETLGEQKRRADARVLATEALSTRLAELEGELEVRATRLKDAESRAGDAHVRAERLVHDQRELDEELRRQRDRGTRLTKQLDDEKRARTKAELELGMLRGRPEIAGAKDRIEALAAELAAARGRIEELEAEGAETRRLGPAQAEAQELARQQAVEAAEAEAGEASLALVERIAELEGVLEDERRARSRLSSERAEATRKAAELEGRLAAEGVRHAELEARLAAERARHAEAESQLSSERARHQGLEARAAAERTRHEGLEARAGAERARHGEAEGRLAAERARHAEVESRLAAERARHAEVESRLAAERARHDALAAQRQAAAEANLAEKQRLVLQSEAREAELGRKVKALEQQLARVAGVPEEEADGELRALEEALRERGRAVAALTRDLRESERIGRELVSELESLSSAAIEGASPLLEDRLEHLAVNAAHCQADLTAAGWRIAQLERELTEAQSGPAAPTVVQAELEAALAAARAEVATLRRAMANGATPGRDAASSHG